MNNLDYKDYLKTLNKISSAIVSDLYLEDILKLIVTLTANVMKAKVCNVFFLPLLLTLYIYYISNRWSNNCYNSFFILSDIALIC
ncbi:unnamed protein product, partial [marine sediment metagenome]